MKEKKAIILAGCRDFGRCPLASRLPLALWPIFDRSVLEQLLRHLFSQNVKQAVICSNGDSGMLQKSVMGPKSMQLTFLNEQLPLGTAGCIRNAINKDKDELLLIFHAGIISLPDIDMMINAHQIGKSMLTVMLNPTYKNHEANRHLPEIFICESDVVEYISAEGYFDLKEGLIPAMVRAGQTVKASTLPDPVINFRDRVGYLKAIASYLDNCQNTNLDISQYKQNDSKGVWLAESAHVSASARIYGPTVIMENATISQNAIILGPAVIGKNVTIGQNTLVENSVFWNDSTIGQDCQIKNALVDYNAKVSHNRTVEDKAIICRKNTHHQNKKNKALLGINRKANRLQSIAIVLPNIINTKLLPWLRINDKFQSGILPKVGLIALASLFIWFYWPEIKELCGVWRRSDEYSFGMMVPFLALYILWTKRMEIKAIPLKPSLWGLFFFITAQILRYFGLYFMYASAERLSLVLSIAALTLLLFGWQFCYKISPLFLFLCLMLPLPRSVHTALILPLQNIATTLAVFFLEIMDFSVVRQGNIIHLKGISVAVAEACNGLKMVTSFFIIIGFVVLLIRKAWWKKLIILISGIPVALLCNAIRLTITAIIFTMFSGKNLENIFHDFSGYAMMPLALVMIIFELRFLSQLTSESQNIPIPNEFARQAGS